jgi:glycosyltransferase involved in cell wall biosynthesis
MVEVLGDDFTYCDPNDAESVAKAILNPNRNKKLPRNYSWEKTAKETLEVYQHV